MLIIGGTFDPPHLGHVALPAAARDALDPAAWLLYVPAAQSPLKAAPGAPAAHRLAMLRIALAETPRAAIWTDELDRAGLGTATVPAASSGPPSYTIDTLRRAGAAAPRARFRLVLGADQAANFHRWRDYRGVMQLAPPLVLLREPFPTREALRVALLGTGAWRAEDIGRWLDAVAETPHNPASATAVRDAAARGVDLPDLDPKVYQYIRERGLYA